MPSTANSSFLQLKRHLSRSARAWRRCLASGWSPIGARTGAARPDSVPALGGPIKDRDGNVIVNADSGLPGSTDFDLHAAIAPVSWRRCRRRASRLGHASYRRFSPRRPLPKPVLCIQRRLGQLPVAHHCDSPDRNLRIHGYTWGRSMRIRGRNPSVVSWHRLNWKRRRGGAFTVSKSPTTSALLESDDRLGTGQEAARG
jgi:hypothetical protein